MLEHWSAARPIWVSTSMNTRPAPMVQEPFFSRSICLSLSVATISSMTSSRGSMRLAMDSSPLAKASTVRSIISVSAEESIFSSFFAVSEKACPSATRRALRSSMFVA